MADLMRHAESFAGFGELAFRRAPDNDLGLTAARYKRCLDERPGSPLSNAQGESELFGELMKVDRSGPVLTEAESVSSKVLD
jgi:hypothetical protein